MELAPYVQLVSLNLLWKKLCTASSPAPEPIKESLVRIPAARAEVPPARYTHAQGDNSHNQKVQVFTPKRQDTSLTSGTCHKSHLLLLAFEKGRGAEWGGRQGAGTAYSALSECQSTGQSFPFFMAPVV